MKWERINPYCLKCGPWRIAKHGGDAPNYMLTHDNGHMSWHASADEAKEVASERDTKAA